MLTMFWLTLCFAFRSCKDFTLCLEEEYEVEEPTSTSDRKCSPQRKCLGNQFARVNATFTSDRYEHCTYSICEKIWIYIGYFRTWKIFITCARICQDFAVCGPDEKESRPPGPYHDRECQCLRRLQDKIPRLVCNTWVIISFRRVLEKWVCMVLFVSLCVWSCLSLYLHCRCIDFKGNSKISTA